jgi:hypothetical protein
MIKTIKLALSILLIVLVQNHLPAQTEILGTNNKYGKILDDLQHNLNDSARIRTVMLDGEERLLFVEWVRDHIHTMKAYKYWEKDLGSFIDFFLGRQSPTGMYYDYYMSYKDHNVGQLYFTNCFDRQFYFVDVSNQNFFFRMPIEAYLEYLMVEGVYAYWQASGNLKFVEEWLPTLSKGMKYEMTDPLRWSSKYLLVKRPYSIDTWDFASDPDSLDGLDRLLYHIGNTEETPKGIMHGDNSGMFQACRQLAKMYAATNQTDKANEWDIQGDLFLQRLNSTCWNGKHYAHFIPEDPLPSHLKTDPIHSLSLSNTYSMNRGSTTPSMAASIIDSYKKVEEEMKESSLASWFGIYPFIYPHFGDYPAGDYVNGAIIPLVGGELTKAAFQNGRERFAVKQLDILDQILDLNQRYLHGCINQDGTKQVEAIPAEWGQAAFVSALVEGLAGVVDESKQFRDVEISPRWYFADIESTNVKIGYGGDGNQVS